jgi:hypothetical protein
MVKKKQPIGYQTSSAGIQQWLDETKGSIRKKEVDWRKELDTDIGLETQSDEFLRREWASPKRDALMVKYLYDRSISWHMMTLIAKLGLDMVKLSEQVAETQKMCKELKLATRGLPED